jgi:hypothetical protein
MGMHESVHPQITDRAAYDRYTIPECGPNIPRSTVVGECPLIIESTCDRDKLVLTAFA